jgi:hypothetical protein
MIEVTSAETESGELRIDRGTIAMWARTRPSTGNAERRARLSF